jgi:hypothetical protein
MPIDPGFETSVFTALIEAAIGDVLDCAHIRRWHGVPVHARNERNVYACMCEAQSAHENGTRSLNVW